MKPLNQEGFLAFFDKMYDFMPKSFEDYDRFLHKELKSFFDGCGIQKVEYSVSIPSELAFLKVVPKRSITGPVETEEWKTLHFEYPFETDGKIEYFVYTEGDSKECGEIEIIFRQLYYTLKSLMLSACCEKLINTDCVMGIPNIKSYFQFGNRVIAQGRAEQYMAVYFNIHNFRTVHRSLAYFECNSMMERYCYTLQTLMDENEFVARLGGDNFVAFILKEHERRFIEKIQNITIDYEKNGQLLTFTFGATIGMASCAGAKSTGEVMVKTSAAYQASRENRVLLSYYDEKVNHEIVERRAILSRFNNGIREREFFAVYQPQVDVKTHTLIGIEALARWRQGQDNLMPLSFISVLERDGCITILDFYILEEACRFLRRLIDENMEPVRVSVNFSKRHLTNDRLVAQIMEVIDRYGISHEYIVVELTESEDYQNNRVMAGIVEQLRTEGVKTSIDDFGTGYSSLAMLNTLRVDELKIDRSFIPKNPADGSDKGLFMLKGIINLAKGLGLSAVAEGVETPEQLELIESLGCDAVQGYIFDKPLPEEELIERIKNRRYT